MKFGKEDVRTTESALFPEQNYVVEESSRPVILAFSDFYLPGYKSGGSMRTLVNTVDRLGRKFNFRIITRDHDGKSDKTPYEGVTPNAWNSIGNASVKYLKKKRITLAEVQKIVEEVSPDAIYSNSYFSTFTILVLLLRKFRRIKATPIIIAPEGEISPAGLELKRGKKRLFMKAASALRLYDDIIWKTTSDLEASDVRGLTVKNASIFVAPNMPPTAILPQYRQNEKPLKEAGKLRLVYLSRIHPVKNLQFLLEILGQVSGNVSLDVFGPVDADPEYIATCHQLVDRLPDSISVEFKGGVEHDKVPQTLFNYEFFVLASLTENFGHVFLEALAAGCPLVISDRTPWVGLEKLGIGWDLSLDDRGRWVEILDRCIQMEESEYAAISDRSRKYAEAWLANDEVELATVKVIEHSLGKSAVR